MVRSASWLKRRPRSGRSRYSSLHPACVVTANRFQSRTNWAPKSFSRSRSLRTASRAAACARRRSRCVTVRYPAPARSVSTRAGVRARMRSRKLGNEGCERLSSSLMTRSFLQKKLTANCFLQSSHQLFAQAVVQTRRPVSFIYTRRLQPLQKLRRRLESEEPPRGQRIMKAGGLVVEHHVVSAGNTHEVVASRRGQQQKQIVG